MNKFNKGFSALYVLLALAVIGSIVAIATGGFKNNNVPGKSQSAAAVSADLASAANFAVLASTYTNTTAGTTVSGDVGYTTGPAVTPTINGTTHLADGAYNTAGTNQNSALSSLNAQTCDFSFGSATDLSLLAQPLTAGVYCITGAQSVGTGGITLGSGIYIFRSTGALNTVANSNITGGNACNVFWTPGEATTLGANSSFLGTDIDAAGITVGSTVNWNGRALAFGGTVTTDTDTITAPTCAAPEVVVPVVPVSSATLHVIKQVVNNSGGVSVASDFNIHVKLSGADVSGSPATGTVAPGTFYSLSAGTYVVSEDTNASYAQSFSGACDSSGSVTLSSGADVTCTIVNDDIEPVVALPVVVTPPVVVAPIVTPTLPQTGYPPQEKNNILNIIIPAGLLGVMLSFYLARKKHTI